MAKRVKRAPSLPNVTPNVRDSLTQVNRVLYQDGVEQNYRLNLALPKDGTEPMEAPLTFRSFATVDLPAASSYEGAVVYDSTTNQLKYSDGANWIVITPGTDTSTFLRIDGTNAMTAPLPLQNVATGSLPSAASNEGDILYDTTLNRFAWSDGVNWKYAPAYPTTMTGVPAFSAHKNGTDQTGVADSTTTAVTFSTELFDVGGFFATNRWTPPAGIVCLSAAYLASGTFGTNNNIAITKNGTTTVFRFAVGPTLAGGGLAGATITITDQANGTDVYGVAAFMDTTAGTATIEGDATGTWFMGHWVST